MIYFGILTNLRKHNMEIKDLVDSQTISLGNLIKLMVLEL